MSTRAEILAHAVRAVRPIVIGAADADLASATPYRQWRLAELAQHTLGTLAGLARLGRREALDADDPWGTRTSEEPWSPVWWSGSTISRSLVGRRLLGGAGRHGWFVDAGTHGR
ncbi:MAG TPA: hypothetical protein VEX57_08410 [Microlunatus sp.]|nr:hypothetical protein [Microlunatus sp.]